MTRPAGKPQQFATNELFSDSPNPWHNTPTKLRPSDGQAAAGLYLPDAPIVADYANARDNDHSRRLLDLDAVEIRNWTAHIKTIYAGPTPSGTPTVAQGVGCKLFDPERPLLFMANEDEILISYDLGMTWAVDFSVGGGSGVITSYVQTDGPVVGNFVGFEVGGAGQVARTTLASAWGSQALTSCTAIKSIRWDPYENLIVVVGTHSGSFGIWKAPCISGALAFTAFDTGDAAVANGHFAASPTISLAASDTTLHRWTSAGAFTPVSTLGPQNGALNITELVWLPEDEVFMLVAHSAGAAEVWTSPDGSSWTNRSSLLPAAFQGVISQTGMVRGSLFAMAGEMTSSHFGILWTGDAGETWNWVPDPTPLGGATPTNGVQVMGLGDAQWLAASYDGSGQFTIAYGQRMGG